MNKGAYHLADDLSLQEKLGALHPLIPAI